MDPRYDVYRGWISSVLNTTDMKNFKYSPNHEYNAIVEHRDSPWGEDFYNLICSEFNVSNEDILDFCNKNDSIGGAELIQHTFGKCSVNSVKYVYHAHLILKHMAELNISPVSIVEIGGGYGGLALAILHYAKKFNVTIQEYNIVDLDEACKLQEAYLRLFVEDMSMFKFHSAYEYGKTINKDNLYLIGVYSIGEFLYDIQTQYINILFPKASHGFMDWNERPRDLPKQCVRMAERPLTGPHNHFIYF